MFHINHVTKDIVDRNAWFARASFGAFAARAASGLDRVPFILWLTAGVLFGQTGWRWIWSAWTDWPSRTCAIVVAASTVAISGLSLRRPLFGRIVAALVMVVVGAGQVGSRLAPRMPDDHVAHRIGATVEVRGRVAERPREGERTRLLLTVDSIRLDGGWKSGSGLVQVTIDAPRNRWRRGDRIGATLRLRPVRNFGNPGEFDYAAFLARRGVYATAFARDDVGWWHEPGAARFAWLDRWREAIGDLIRESLDGAPEELVSALLIGTTEVSPPLRERYAKTGLSHVLSISGLHISLVAVGALTVVQWILARRHRLLLTHNVPRLATAISSIPVLLYSGIAGASVPTVRSVIMGLLVLLAVLVGRQRSTWAAIGAALLFVCLLSPGAASEVSCQLSFAAVIFIVLGVRRTAELWEEVERKHGRRLSERNWRRLRWLVSYFGVTVFAVAGTAPISVLHFNQFSLSTFIANPVVIPLLGAAPIGLGLAAAGLTPLAPSLARWLLVAAGGIVEGADRVVQVLAALPGSAVRLVTPTTVEVVALYLVFGGVLSRSPVRRIAMIAGGVLLVAATFVRLGPHAFTAPLRITFLSVGQGDAAVIEFPNRSVMVVDGGGIAPRFDPGERILAPYLWWRGHARVDTVVLSHPDFDHYAGLTYLIGQFTPREFWWNGQRGSGPTYLRLEQAIESTGTPTRIVRRGFERRFGDATVTVLSPDDDPAARENDESVAMTIRYAGVTVLLAGDMEVAAERELLAETPDLLPSMVLKVPHHGSRTSSTDGFIAAVRPRLAVISAGYANRFHMPHRETLDTLRRHGVAVLRTDESGAIVVEVDASGGVEVRRGPTEREFDLSQGKSDLADVSL